MTISRRDFMRFAGTAGTLSLAGCAATSSGPSAGRVVVIGGGFGGATAAKYAKKLDPKLDVTLIERDASFITCPFSNYVLGGFKKMTDITHGFGPLQQAHKVKLMRGDANGIDTAKRQVKLASGAVVAYDKLVVSPGIELDFAALPGYDAKAAEKMPHAWKAGAQTQLLRQQLEAMKDGETFILVAPDNPFRCPPGPYERVSMVAWYFKNAKPKSKILVLDAKNAFSKQGLFQKAWESEYPGMINWVAGKDGGKVESVDPGAMTVKAGFGAEKGAVINVIPPQTAGAIAKMAGLTDEKGWCPVDANTFASKKAENVYVVGDASIAGAMPKSGSSANTQAKVAAAALVASLQGKAADAAALFNICYSLVTPTYGISVTNAYAATADKGIIAVPNSGGVSPGDAPAQTRKLEAEYTMGWYRSITRDVWG